MKAKFLVELVVLMLLFALIITLDCDALTPNLKPSQGELEATASYLTQTKVVLLSVPKVIYREDEVSIQKLCKELQVPLKRGDYRFVNDESQWFDEEGKRRFDIFIISGQAGPLLFGKTYNSGDGINEMGCQNIREFIRKGGSAIGICHVGPHIFAKTWIWIGLIQKQIKDGVKWAPFTHQRRGGLVSLCNGEPIFKGMVRGPQESNLPYPRIRFLPIKLNMENPIVKEAKLPDTVYLWVCAGGSLIPDPNQPMEVIGWFPNGTAAIASVRYGQGSLYMMAPHPNLTASATVSWAAAKQEGQSYEQFKEAISILDKEGDPDGPDLDWALMKAIFKDAARRASTTAK